MENSPFLLGRIHIFIHDDEVDQVAAERFLSLFRPNCGNLRLVHRALMTIADYGNLGNGCCQYGFGLLDSSIWKERIFDISNDRVKAPLIELLRLTDGDVSRLEPLIEQYIADCRRQNRYPWQYYMACYPEMMNMNQYGRFYISNPEEPYCRRSFLTATTCGRFTDPLLNAVAVETNCLQEWFTGQGTEPFLSLGDSEVSFDNSAYYLNGETHPIPQTDGIDTVDRVALVIEAIENS